MKTKSDRKAIVIGSGFAGLSAATFLAKDGWNVTVLEKLGSPGGRARKMMADGFTFDMGPSWYWMPDVFDRYFSAFGKKTSDYYTLKRLDPSYRIFWENEFDDIPADLPSLKALFESWEPGAGNELEHFLNDAAKKYQIGMQQLVYQPSRSLGEFITPQVMKGLFTMQLFTSIKQLVASRFKDPRIRQILEFPVLFLGALPSETPALYSLMNYADIVGGTWYPLGGMHKIVDAIHDLAMELGVTFCFNEEVTSLNISKKSVTSVATKTREYPAEIVIAGADYHHVERELLPASLRNYDEAYWDSRQLSPSCLLYYVGINKKLKKVRHHNLFFDTDFKVHANEIYRSKTWPDNPLFYVSVTSLTDPAMAPENHENLFFLIPVSAGLEQDDEILRESYFKKILDRFEKHTGESIAAHIIYKKSYSLSDFKNDYHSYKGNAYGLANTLKQTAILKPSCKNKHLDNLYYTGQLTIPGPGVPPSLISGEVVARLANKQNSVS